MKTALVFSMMVLCAVALPRNRRQEGAEVVRIVDEKTPILLAAGQQDSDNVIDVVVPLEIRQSNGTAGDAEVESSSPAVPPAPPTPVPENVAITTEKFPENTPSLVPTVVDVSTVDPNNTPPPPAAANATSSAPAEEDEEDSEEEGSEEEADDEDEEEEEEEEEEDEADDDEEEDEEDEEADAKAKKDVKKKVKREVAAGEEVQHSFKEGGSSGGSVVIDGEGEKQSDEEVDKDVGEKKQVEGAGVPGVPAGSGVVAGSGGALQGVPARGATGEDDEADSALIPTSNTPASIVIAS